MGETYSRGLAVPLEAGEADAEASAGAAGVAEGRVVAADLAGERRVATRLELCTSASSASGPPRTRRPRRGIGPPSAGGRGGWTRGWSCAPGGLDDTLVRAGVGADHGNGAARARGEAVADRGRNGGERASGGVVVLLGWSEKIVAISASTGIGRGDARRDEPAARAPGEGARGGKRARERVGHRVRAHSRRRRVAE